MVISMGGLLLYSILLGSSALLEDNTLVKNNDHLYAKIAVDYRVPDRTHTLSQQTVSIPPRSPPTTKAPRAAETLNLTTRLTIQLDTLRPHAGIHGPLLIGEQFYRYIGQPRLAKQYRHNQRVRTNWLFLGAQLTGTALGVSTIGAISLTCSPQRSTHVMCNNSFKIALFGGLSAALVGLVTTGITMLIDPHPVSIEEQYHLAQRYNSELRTKTFSLLSYTRHSQ